MPSTSCTCIGNLGERRFDVVLVDPTCRVHGDRSLVATPPSRPGT